MELEVFFTIFQQTYSKLVISFMNRKSSCGYATHFFCIAIQNGCKNQHGVLKTKILIYLVFMYGF
jgi:hypothetical protein